MKELKSSVGLGGKPGEGGEEVRQDDFEDCDDDDDGNDDDDDDDDIDGYGDNDDDESEEEDDGLWLMIDFCCYRWQVQPLDLILNLWWPCRWANHPIISSTIKIMFNIN